MKFASVSLLVLAAIAAVPVFAESTIDDAIKLAAAGMGEEVIVAWSERQEVSNLTAQDIIRLKEGKVPDRAIATLIRSGATHSMGSGARILKRDDQGNLVERQEAPPIQQQTVPAVQRYVAQPSTTYVSTSYVQPATYVYADSYPVYYSSYYPYYYSSGYCYPRYYSSCYPSFGLSFNFGRGYYGGYSSFGGYRGGYSGGYRGGFSGGFHSGFSGGFRGGRR